MSVEPGTHGRALPATLADPPPLGATASDRRRRLAAALVIAGLLLTLLGVMVGSQGWSWPAFVADWQGEQAALILGQIRLPRTLGAFAVGALLGLAGAVAQGLFRNPLADPYLLGSAAGAGLAVVVVLAVLIHGGAGFNPGIGPAGMQWLARLGLVVAAFLGALGGVLLTLAISRGAQQTLRLLLAGVVVGVLLGALSDLVSTWSPEVLRGRQTFLLGSTGYLGWASVAILGGGLLCVLPPALRLARVLDALTLGDDSAASLGLDLPRLRLLLVLVLALCTGLAVSQAGLVAFVGLVAPHLVRRYAPAPHAYTLAASAAVGGVLLLGADVLARGLLAPQELPVGVVTAVLGGAYLLWLLSRRGAAA
jgi:iron complex transport system permease protein